MEGLSISTFAFRAFLYQESAQFVLLGGLNLTTYGLKVHRLKTTNIIRLIFG